MSKKTKPFFFPAISQIFHARLPNSNPSNCEEKRAAFSFFTTYFDGKRERNSNTAAKLCQSLTQSLKQGGNLRTPTTKQNSKKKIAMRNFASLLLLQVFFIAAPIRKRLITLQKLTFYCSKVKLTLVNRGFMLVYSI